MNERPKSSFEPQDPLGPGKIYLESYNNYIGCFVQLYTSIKNNESQQMKLSGVLDGIFQFEDGVKLRLTDKAGLPVFCRLENILLFIPTVKQEEEENDESEQEEEA